MIRHQCARNGCYCPPEYGTNGLRSKLSKLINVYNADSHDVFQGDRQGGEKWRIAWKQGELCSDWWFADPSNSQIHDQGLAEAPRKGSKLRRPKATALVSTGPTPAAGSGLTTQTASIGSGCHEVEAAGSVLLQQDKAEQPATDQHKAPPLASAASSSAVEGTVSGQEGTAAQRVYESLRTALPAALPTALPTALASTADSPGVKDNKRRRAEERQRSILESCNPKEAVAGQENERELGKGKEQAVDHGKSTVEEQQQAGITDLSSWDPHLHYIKQAGSSQLDLDLKGMNCHYALPANSY
ncbi:hypothetical protein ABBQ38_008433 [Trebouxia sp. C0009 RCD-2024]